MLFLSSAHFIAKKSNYYLTYEIRGSTPKGDACYEIVWEKKSFKDYFKKASEA